MQTAGSMESDLAIRRIREDGKIQVALFLKREVIVLVEYTITGVQAVGSANNYGIIPRDHGDEILLIRTGYGDHAITIQPLVGSGETLARPKGGIVDFNHCRVDKIHDQMQEYQGITAARTLHNIAVSRARISIGVIIYPGMSITCIDGIITIAFLAIGEL